MNSFRCIAFRTFFSFTSYSSTSAYLPDQNSSSPARKLYISFCSRLFLDSYFLTCSFCMLSIEYIVSFLFVRQAVADGAPIVFELTLPRHSQRFFPAITIFLSKQQHANNVSCNNVFPGKTTACKSIVYREKKHCADIYFKNRLIHLWQQRFFAYLSFSTETSLILHCHDKRRRRIQLSK